jgi:hypothetical protein
MVVLSRKEWEQWRILIVGTLLVYKAYSIPSRAETYSHVEIVPKCWNSRRVICILVERGCIQEIYHLHLKVKKDGNTRTSTGKRAGSFTQVGWHGILSIGIACRTMPFLREPRQHFAAFNTDRIAMFCFFGLLEGWYSCHLAWITGSNRDDWALNPIDSVTRYEIKAELKQCIYFYLCLS